MQFSSWQNWIYDILEAIAEIESFTNSLNFEKFQAEQKAVKAVLYNMAIIGEAARNIPPEVEAGFSEIPWAEVRGRRNVVIHEYFRLPTRLDRVSIPLRGIGSLKPTHMKPIQYLVFKVHLRQTTENSP